MRNKLDEKDYNKFGMIIIEWYCGKDYFNSFLLLCTFKQEDPKTIETFIEWEVDTWMNHFLYCCSSKLKEIFF